MRRSRHVEPWPIGIALSLGAMIAIAIGFWAIAAANPDPVLVTSDKPGVEAP